MKGFQKISLRLRITLLTGAMILVVSLLLTYASMYNAGNRFSVLSKAIETNNSIKNEVNGDAGVRAVSMTALRAKDIGAFGAAQLTPVQMTARLTHQFNYWSYIYMILVAGMGMAASWFLAGRALAPVRHLSEAAADIGGGNLTRRIPTVETKDEIGELTEAFNGMAEKLEESFERQKRFSSNVAHELKTPLATLKMSLQLGRLECGEERRVAESLLPAGSKDPAEGQGDAGAKGRARVQNSEREQSSARMQDSEREQSSARMQDREREQSSARMQDREREQSSARMQDSVMEQSSARMQDSVMEQSNARMQDSEREQSSARMQDSEREQSCTRMQDNVMEQGDGTDSRREAEAVFAVAERSVDRLIGVVDELLTLTNEGTLQMEEVELPQMLRGITEEILPLYLEKGIQVEYVFPEEGCALQGDAGLIRRIFFNLIENGMKYNVKGGILRIAVERQGQRLQITVSDSGPGIKKEDLERVFEPFFCVNSSRSRKLGGAGLGLSIARAAAERHGWSIAADSVPNAGTAFVVTAPYR